MGRPLYLLPFLPLWLGAGKEILWLFCFYLLITKNLTAHLLWTRVDMLLCKRKCKKQKVCTSKKKQAWYQTIVGTNRCQKDPTSAPALPLVSQLESQKVSLLFYSCCHICRHQLWCSSSQHSDTCENQGSNSRVFDEPLLLPSPFPINLP